jgi:predicted ATPase
VAGLLGECRLVTVTGPGGVGKTRVADQAARQVAGWFADGAWLAELAAVRDLAQGPDVDDVSAPSRCSALIAVQRRR